MISPLEFPNETSPQLKVEIVAAKLQEVITYLNGTTTPSKARKEDCVHTTAYITKRGTRFCPECSRFIKKEIQDEVFLHI